MCRLYFLTRCGQFNIETLSRRLGIPVVDSKDKARFHARYRDAFWRVRIAPWRTSHDEIALTLRRVDELNRALPLLAECLRSLRVAETGD